jgi:dimethylargininase
MPRQIALVRSPSPRLAEGLVTHIERSEVDVDLALQQWQRYVDVLRDHQWDVVEVPPAPDCPDSAFVEDTVVMFRNVAVLAAPGADERRDEVAGTAEVVEALGCSINRIRPPGTLDGGDVLKIGDTVFVGRGGRTNDDGVRQLRAILEPLGARVVAVPLTKVLHLKSAVTALPDGTVVGYAPLVDDPSVFGRFLGVPEESGSHVVLLGDDRLLMAADAPQSAELFRRLGYQPVEVDISEYIKLEGCVTCLSVRVRHLH